ncbi:MAG: hypothetical protein DRI90_09110 [Deltaproteobacteria bacterium]|nr:MAG: hypothetical protein DRI90_09110 [Deltaproteobacteria bacterium]
MLRATRTSSYFRLALNMVPTLIAVVALSSGSAEIAAALVAIDASAQSQWSSAPGLPPAPVLQPHIRPPRLVSRSLAHRCAKPPARRAQPVKVPPAPHQPATGDGETAALPWQTGLVELLDRSPPGRPIDRALASWQQPSRNGATDLSHWAGGASGLQLSSTGEGSTARATPISLDPSAMISQGESGRLLTASIDPPAAPPARFGPSVAAPEDTTRRLPPERVAHVVRLNRGRLRACYQRGLVRDATLAGRVVVRFAIDPDGSVTQTSASSSLGDADVVACIVQTFRGLTFPATEGGRIDVQYPLVLSPRDGEPR